MNSFTHDMMNRLTIEATQLAQLSGRDGFGVQELQKAVALVLPGELAKHAISEGTKALTKYTASRQ